MKAMAVADRAEAVQASAAVDKVVGVGLAITSCTMTDMTVITNTARRVKATVKAARPPAVRLREGAAVVRSRVDLAVKRLKVERGKQLAT